MIMMLAVVKTPVQVMYHPCCPLCFGRDLALAPETCEELFTPAAPHIFLALSGVEVFSNGSGSHHQVLRYNTAMRHSKILSGRVAQILQVSSHSPSGLTVI